MGVFLSILKYIIQLAPQAVLATETLVGDMKDNATKKQMATDMLNAATKGAVSVTTGQTQALTQIASTVVGIAIDNAVNITKAQGTYQKATAIANVVNQDAQVAGAILNVPTTTVVTQSQSTVHP